MTSSNEYLSGSRLGYHDEEQRASGDWKQADSGAVKDWILEKGSERFVYTDMYI